MFRRNQTLLQQRHHTPVIRILSRYFWSPLWLELNGWSITHLWLVMAPDGSTGLPSRTSKHLFGYIINSKCLDFKMAILIKISVTHFPYQASGLLKTAISPFWGSSHATKNFLTNVCYFRKTLHWAIIDLRPSRRSGCPPQTCPWNRTESHCRYKCPVLW